MSDPEVERLFNERDCRHSDREGGTCCTTCAKDIAASLRARLLTLEQGLHEQGERAKWALIWSLLEEFGITRANGCPDSILRQEWDALKQRATAAEARAEAANALLTALGYPPIAECEEGRRE